jgi:hypothetical protein
MVSSLKNFYCMYPLVKNVLIGKKEKATQCLVFAQDMGIRNWMKILLASTPLPPFTTAKKTWEQASCKFFFEVHS